MPDFWDTEAVSAKKVCGSYKNSPQPQCLYQSVVVSDCLLFIKKRSSSLQVTTFLLGKFLFRTASLIIKTSSNTHAQKRISCQAVCVGHIPPDITSVSYRGGLVGGKRLSEKQKSPLTWHITIYHMVIRAILYQALFPFHISPKCHLRKPKVIIS